MQQYCIFHDGESETGATHFPASSLVYPIESLKESVEVFLLHSHPIVAEREMPLGAASPFGCNGHLRIVSGICDGIVGKVSEYAVYQP